MSLIDLRSDTVTKPCAGMRKAMADAEVGDDVIGHDPSVDRLEAQIAEMLGKEAAAFMPSGTMANQIGVRVHCGPGDEFLCESGCHIFNFEQAAFASLSGVSVYPVDGNAGSLTVDDVKNRIRPISMHEARTKLLCLENTHNKAGGRIQCFQTVKNLCTWAKENDLACHLDGARLFNASVATGVDVATISKPFDTVSVCFSKGLGAPVGSALVGNKDMIANAKWHRKAFGGAMRQSGILAAAVSFALANNIDRLAADHQNAETIAQAVAETEGVQMVFPGKKRLLDSNIVLFDVDPELGTSAQAVEFLRGQGIDCFPFGPTWVRMVTHWHITSSDAEAAATAVKKLPELRS